MADADKIISNYDPAPGKTIDTTLGYVETGTKIAGVLALSLASGSVSRAENTWYSYVRDTAKFVDAHETLPAPSGSDTGVENESRYYSTAVPQRLKEAAFYYAMEQYAAELLRLRIGNVGADPTSPVAETVIRKAMALAELAAERLQAYEKWCAAEAGVLGAHYQGILEFALKVPNYSEQIASAFWYGVPADGATNIEPSADGEATSDFISNMALAVGMQVIGANILQRKLGYSGARNQALGDYYLNAGKQMSAQGTETVAKYVQFAMSEHPQHAMSYLGL